MNRIVAASGAFDALGLISCMLIVKRISTCHMKLSLSYYHSYHNLYYDFFKFHTDLSIYLSIPLSVFLSLILSIYLSTYLFLCIDPLLYW